MQIPENSEIEVLPPAEDYDVYFPDEPKAREAAKRMFPLKVTGELFRVGFCKQFKRLVQPNGAKDDRLCHFRDPRWMEGHNKCRRCAAGFLNEGVRGELDRKEERPQEV